MVKLKDAKCPNCGANIQVNDKLENTICQYCGSQVVIEEAIEKYKLEISGKVEVDGIKGRNSKLEQARKHIKLEEYGAAKNIINGIIAEDSLDVEAYIELIKIDIELFKQREFNENTSDLTDYDGWTLFNEIINNYERANKIDDDDIVEKGLSEYKEDIDNYLELNKRVKEEEEELSQMTKKLNDYYDQVKSVSATCAKSWIDELISKKFDMGGYTTQFCSNVYQGHYYNDTYQLMGFKRITRDGILECKYRRITSNYGTNVLNVDLHSTNAKTVDSINEIKGIIAEIEQVTPNYVQTQRETTNKEIDKQNKRLDRQNTVLSAKNQFTKIRIYLDYAIIAILVIASLGVLFSKGFGSFIAMVIFLDSWAIWLCWSKSKEHKYDLKINDINKKTNNIKKREHV